MIFGRFDSGVVTVNPDCIIKDDNIEFRYDEPEHVTLDEIIAKDVSLLHVEAMDRSQWWMSISFNDGRMFHVNCGAVNPRAKGYAFHEQVAERGEPVGRSVFDVEEYQHAYRVLLALTSAHGDHSQLCRYQRDTTACDCWVNKNIERQLTALREAGILG